MFETPWRLLHKIVATQLKSSSQQLTKHENPHRDNRPHHRERAVEEDSRKQTSEIETPITQHNPSSCIHGSYKMEQNAAVDARACQQLM